jgi:hypothetical protein
VTKFRPRPHPPQSLILLFRLPGRLAGVRLHPLRPTRGLRTVSPARVRIIHRSRLPTAGMILDLGGPRLERRLLGRVEAEESGRGHLDLSAEPGKKARGSISTPNPGPSPEGGPAPITPSVVVGCGSIDFSSGGEMKKVLLVLTLVGLGFLAWRYFSNEPV